MGRKDGKVSRIVLYSSHNKGTTDEFLDLQVRCYLERSRWSCLPPSMVSRLAVACQRQQRQHFEGETLQD
jgi:hypothetical protein